MSVASASLPVIGKRLEPLGAATAMGIWGYRHAPDFVASTARAWRSPRHGEIRKQDRESTNAVAEAALRGIVPAADLAIEWPAPERTPPVLKLPAAPAQRASDLGSLRRPSRTVAGRVAPQGPARRTGAGADLRARRRLDPRRPTAAGLRTDVVPGREGLGVSVHDYRGAPHHRWPQHITDVKTAIAWAHANVDRFGGDRNFVAVAGFRPADTCRRWPA